MIDSYDFGTIVVNGRKFTTDLIISNKGINPKWWRKEGHRLSLEDIKDVLAQTPEILIIGTGYSGVMSVPKSVEDYIRAKGINIIVKRTEEACKKFNELYEKHDVVAALHLTC
ncbi:MAG: hypothetical protein JSV09_14430 [Thermoplasmata archaeon]|nr:MAG: hypothetical protein JSV09_14430 [Thermoplasmata archaeon]